MLIVVKVGTSLLVDKSGKVNKRFLKKLVRQVAELQGQGHQVAIVTSGAVATGRGVFDKMRGEKYA